MSAIIYGDMVLAQDRPGFDFDQLTWADHNCRSYEVLAPMLRRAAGPYTHWNAGVERLRCIRALPCILCRQTFTAQLWPPSRQMWWASRPSSALLLKHVLGWAIGSQACMHTLFEITRSNPFLSIYDAGASSCQLLKKWRVMQ